jgi:glycosyltransferase involved in cell wall biosynthesis
MADGVVASLGIVIPTLNAAAFLEHALVSLEPLRSAGAKVIVVDGGSRDQTCEIAERWAVPVLQCRREGMYAALNEGFAAVDGQWLTWLNSDDVLYPSTTIDRLKAANHADIHYGAVDFIDPDGRFVHSWQSAPSPWLGSLFRAGCSPLLQQGTFFRRRVFEKLGGFVETYRFVADADFWWRAIEQGFQFERLRSPTVAGFRLHRGQLSQRHETAMQAEHLQMARQHGVTRAMRWWSPAVLRFRFSNSRRYMLRALRSADLEGRLRLTRSYQVVGSMEMNRSG